MVQQIPCVSCRVCTLAADPNAPVQCHACGVVLPAASARAWQLSRGGAPFGPYTIAELAAYIGEGRVLADDNVWHDGAAVRILVNQLPSLGGAAPAGAAMPYQGALAAGAMAGAGQFAAMTSAGFQHHMKRAFNWDLSSVPVEPDEDAKLIANGVDELDARRYLVWRRSVLTVVTIPTLISAVLATFGFLGREPNPPLSGIGNLLELGRLAALFALPLTAWLALKCWDRHRRSRRILLRGWLFAFLLPLALALVPYSWRIEMGNADPTAMAQARAAWGFAGAVMVYISLTPAVLSLIPGVLRACLRIKTLIPESILPGVFLIGATPLYILLFLVIFTTINQVAASLLLIMSVFALLGGPVFYLLNAGTLTRPLHSPEDRAKVGTIQKTVSLVVMIGVGLLLMYVFTATIMDRALIGSDPQTSWIRPWNTSLIQYPIEYVVRSAFTTALVADLIMFMNLQLWRHTQAFQATPEARAYDRLMNEIEEAGGSALNERSEVVQPGQH